MDLDLVPDHLRDAMRDFERSLAETRTRRIRLESVELPDMDGPTAADLDRAARQPDAPRELRDLARAVDEGRASWDDVLHPGSPRTQQPEVSAYFAGAPAALTSLIARGEEADRQAAGERSGRSEPNR